MRIKPYKLAHNLCLSATIDQPRAFWFAKSTHPGAWSRREGSTGTAMDSLTPAHFFGLISVLCVSVPTLTALRTLRLARFPIKQAKPKGYAFLFRIVRISLKNFLSRSKLSTDEVLDRKIYSNVADNALITIALTFISLAIFISSIISVASNPETDDFFISSILSIGNAFIIVAQYTILSKEKRIFEGKEKSGVASRYEELSDFRIDVSLGVQGRGSAKDVQATSLDEIGNDELEHLVRNSIQVERNPSETRERDRERVWSAWSSSKYRALVEFSDESRHESEKGGIQNPNRTNL